MIWRICVWIIINVLLLIGVADQLHHLAGRIHAVVVHSRSKRLPPYCAFGIGNPPSAAPCIPDPGNTLDCRNHAQQRGLAHAGIGEHTDTLALANGYGAVNGLCAEPISFSNRAFKAALNSLSWPLIESPFSTRSSSS